MLRKVFVFGLLFSLLINHNIIKAHNTAKQIQLSDQSQISILTFKPGSEMYSMYGHTAIRVNDFEKKLDLIYNYGTFYFNSDSFYLDFIKGKLKYHLSISTYSSTMGEMQYEKRKVIEQVLDLSLDDRQQIVDKLENTYHSEDRFYLYDFLYDNCATRVRDVVELPVHKSIYTDTTLFQAQSFRQLLQPYLQPYYWLDLGINLLLNQNADKLASVAEQMFLPDHILNIYDQAYYTKESSRNRFTSMQKTIYQPYEDEVEASNRFLSIGWRILIVFVVISLLGFIIKFNTNIIDFILIVIYSLLGILFTILWIISEHAVLQANWNLLWTLPTLAFFFTSAKRKKISNYWLYINLLIVMLLMIPGVIPQSIPAIILPYMVIISFIYMKRLIRINANE